MVTLWVSKMLLPLDEILEFFSRNQIPVLPCFGITNGACNCRKGINCPSPGKHPLMSRWQMLATTDKDKIMSWIGKGQNRSKPINLAIATGKKNSLLGKFLTVADMDLTDHPMKVRLERHSKTVTQRSGGGGDHALYWSSLPVRNSCQLVDEKMDIRGHGGILVIAPSAHKSGNFYEFTCDLRTTEIQDLPDFLEKKLRIAVAEKNKKRERKDPKTKGELPDMAKFWTRKSVDDIRVHLANGDLIPKGVRNVTMHRLLSSDRAKGVPTKSQLMSRANHYLQGFEDPTSFEEELEAIVKSVMKYPAYNNSHERVNELYLGWLGKNGYKKEHDLETLDEFDRKFFDTLEPCSEIDGYVPLSQIVQMREEFLKAQGLKKFATYRPQLLAKKLKQMGIRRKRTAKSNGWAVRLKENPVQTPSPVCNNRLRMECLTMANELKDEEKKKGLKDGDIIDYNGEKVRVELIKTQTKVKAHTREHLYQGRTGYDYNKALLALMPRLTSDEMVDQMEKGELVMDREKTEAWLFQVKDYDIIGVRAERYQVVPGNELSDGLLAVNKVVPVEKKPGEFRKPDPEACVEFLSLGQIDHARELGLLDILWRDGKPFGEPEFRDMNVVLLHDLDESAPTKKGKSSSKKKK